MPVSASFVFYGAYAVMRSVRLNTQLVDKVSLSDLLLCKSGIEINNGESGPFKMGHFPQTPICPKKNAKGGISRSAERDLGLYPKNPQAFEKA